MLIYLQEFFAIILGFELPVVCLQILTLGIMSIAIKKIMSLFALDSKIANYAIYIVMGLLAVCALGGFSLNLTL